MTHLLDLGISGRNAIICGASSGLGRACAMSLGRAGVSLVINARGEAKLNATAKQIVEETGVSVIAVPGDISTEEGRKALVRACPAPDILVTNAGGPPSGDFRGWGEEEWFGALRTNMVSPILLIREVIDGMMARGWGRVINLTSYSVKMPLPLLGMSNGARSGLVGFASGLAREVAPHGVTINNLLPGNFATERLRDYAGKLGKERNMSADEVLAEMAAKTPVRRVGRPEEFGTWCAFLASAHTGYVTGQNFVLDGGTYPGTF
ncbi:MAG: 3-oxoacyl-ACP reductase [Herminiimonas sp.]|nr:3-oxoacyl-ACP reductase [Herminiimonas sp.]